MSNLARIVTLAVLLCWPSPVSTQSPTDAFMSYGEALRLFRDGRFEEARVHAARALSLREAARPSNAAEIAEALLLVGRILDLRAEHDKAEALFTRARAIGETLPESATLLAAETIDRLARHYVIRARYAEAETLAKRALAMRESRVGPDDARLAESWATLADVHQANGDALQTTAAAERALDIASRSIGPDDVDYGEYLVRAGRAALMAANYTRAEQLYSRALALGERLAGTQSSAVGYATAGLANVALMKNENVKSEQLHLRALAIEERWLGPNHYALANMLNNLGLLYYRRNDYANAEAMHLRALQMREHSLGPTHPAIAGSLGNLGLVYWRQRDYAKAKQYFQRALERLEATHGPDSLQVTAQLGNLGIIAKETGDYERGEAYYRRELSIREKVLGPRHPDLALVTESLGILYRDKGDYAKAEPMLLRALAITEGSLGPSNTTVARHLQNLGRLYAAMGDVPKALESWRREVAVEEETLAVDLAVGSERQKLAYFRPLVSAPDRMISLHLQSAPASEGARDLAVTTLLQRKGRVLDAMANNLGAFRARASAEVQDLFARLDRVTSQLASSVLSDPSRVPLAERLERAKTLREQRETLENELNRRTAGYIEPARSITLSEVQRAVPADAALIEFAVYHAADLKAPVESTASSEARYAVYVVRPSRSVGWADLGPVKGIDDAVAVLRRVLANPKDPRARRAGRDLAAKTIDPVASLVGDVRHLLIAADGTLNLVPFEALVDQSGRYLVQRYAITYLTTGRDLLRMQVARPASRSVAEVFANPAFDEPAPAGRTAAARRPQTAAGRVARRSITIADDRSSVYFSPLVGTAAEARTIKTLFPDARVHIGDQASERALKQIDAPRILHIATHGFFLRDASGSTASSSSGDAPIENPLLRSGLALAGANKTRPAGEDDGILTALEASNLNLWGTKLVMLSACDTGIGEVRTGEGVYGLRRALFIAGAESLVMSLWPVSDYVTRETMADYYARLTNGLGRGAALRETQLAMLKRPDRRHPYYWAAFIQSGEWATLDGQR